MRTFDLTLGIDLRVVVPEQFTQTMREKARSEDSSDFFQVAQDMHPDDDEQFTLMILKNGIRHGVREYLQEMLIGSGIGGTLSPAKLAVVDRSPPPDEAAVLPAKIADFVNG